MTWEEACKAVCDDIYHTLVSKQHDYGHGNINDFGLLGVLVRANDKIARLKNLQGKEAKNESLRDTWLDLAGYSVIALMIMDDTFNLDLEKK